MLVKRIINKIIQQFEVRRIPTKEKVVYLTFDDGPEADTFRFVLDELDKYDYKATFFCRGDRAARSPQHIELLRQRGHAVGNHSHSHPNAFNVPAATYVADIEQADRILHTKLLRPPYGSLTLSTWLQLHKKYRMVYWSLDSEDSKLENFNHQQALDKLKAKTKKGDVVLFHFCQRHEKETRQLLPEYLAWLHKEGFKSKGLRS
ncbi:MAG: polysaccharide deacetylase family protein [Bacteroidaceae bacterium]|nr:polysaccharide deacetylase family protein [Bacteroidaceae bacterium]